MDIQRVSLKSITYYSSTEANTSFSKMNDTDFYNWILNFVAVAEVDPPKYGMTDAQILALSNKATDFVQKITARQRVDDAFKTAVLAQRASREGLEPEISFLNTIIKANPALTDAEKQAVGIEPLKAQTFSPPTRPEALVVNGFEDGRNFLKWKRAGNKNNTQFIIEYKKGDAAEFSYLDTTTETILCTVTTCVFGGESRTARLVCSGLKTGSQPVLPWNSMLNL